MELKERPCDPCYQAKADYDKRRLADPDKARKNRAMSRAQSRAYSELAFRHKAEYQELYQHFRAEALAALESLDFDD